MGKVRTAAAVKRVGGREVRIIVAAENGTCSRCTQPIVVGERIANERGFASHRDCIRLGVAVWRSRGRQVSDGWGSDCAECGAVINRGEPWTRTAAGVSHRGCA
jgi:hypothetical protein